MTADPQRELPSWEARYQQQAIESMPWFYLELDDDLRHALAALGLRSGNALDLGTGPGTQALQLARRGFNVTATDISETAIRLAREQAEAQGCAIRWVQDDILATQLAAPFDLIFDRGCFHVLPPEQRQAYVRTVADLLQAGGYLFLKCFSHLQPGTQGPHRFTPDQIQRSLETGYRCARSRTPCTRVRSIRFHVPCFVSCGARDRTTTRMPVEVTNLDRYGSPPLPRNRPRDLLADRSTQPNRAFFFGTRRRAGDSTAVGRAALCAPQPGAVSEECLRAYQSWCICPSRPRSNHLRHAGSNTRLTVSR